MHDVVVVGDCNVDIIVPYPKFLNDERTIVEYPNPSIHGGGTAANTAVALSRLGVYTHMIGSVGDDQYGRFVLDDLAQENVNIDDIAVDKRLNTVSVFAFIDEYGERYLWGWPRENQSFKILDLSKISLDKLFAAEWVHSSGMCLVYNTTARTAITEIFRQVYARGIPTSFDLNLRVDNGILNEDYAEAIDNILPYVNHVLGSGPEEFAYLGDDKWQSNAYKLASKGHTVIARDGKNGSYSFSQNQEYFEQAFDVDVLDTVGAGDVYNAGYIYALLEGYTIRDAIRVANAVSAYAVSRVGARSSPSRKELYEFLNHYN